MTMVCHQPLIYPLALFFLLTPTAAMACGFCIDDQVFSDAPWVYSACGVLILWQVSDWMLRRRNRIVEGTIETLKLGCLGDIVLVTFLIAMVGTIGFVGVLILVSMVFCFRHLCELIFPRSLPALQSRALSLSALVTVIAIVLFGIIWRSGINDLTNLDQLAPESPPALNPRADLEAWLESQAHRDEPELQESREGGTQTPRTG